MTLLEYLVSFVAEKGVTDVFGVPGGVVLDLLYAFRDSAEIAAHLSYHEQGAAFAACGYAQYRYTLGVAYATRGPGFLNMVTGIAEAYSDSIPVLFITAHSDRLVGHNMRFEKDQELDTIQMVRYITKYAAAVDDVRTAVSQIQEAYAQATSGRKGPVVLDFSSNLWNAVLPDTKENCLQFLPTDDCSPHDALQCIAQRLLGAKRPLLLVGDGVRQSDTTDQFAALANQWGLPVVSSRSAQDVGTLCNHYYGYIGSHGIRYSNFIFSKADLVLSLGNRVAFPLNSKSFSKTFDKKRLIRIEIDSNELKRKIPHSETYISDLTSLMQYLIDMDIDLPAFSEWKDICKHLKNELYEEDTCQATDLLSSILEKIDCFPIVCDVGNNEFWTSRTYELLGLKNRAIYAKSFAALGSALGKAIGVHYASKLPVICIAGDQGFQLNMQELQWISQEKLPIIILLLNNHSSGMIRDREEDKYGGQFVHTTKDSGYGTPSFDRVSQAYGIQYCRLSVLEADLTDCFIKKQVGPMIIEIDIDEGMHLFPTLPQGRNLQDMAPFLDRNVYRMLDQL